MKLLSHYGFHKNPFTRVVTPDALFRHRGFNEAISRLEYALELSGIAVLSAESGCGKSLLLSVLAEELRRQKWRVHYVAHTTVGAFSFLNLFARKVGISPRRSRGETAAAISKYLKEEDQQHLLLIDEAQELPDDTLDDIRLLTIGEFDRESPFQLMFSGQPSFDDTLRQSRHYALDQRILTVARLSPLSHEETRTYLNRRLSDAGSGARPVFEEGAIDGLFDISAGVPRRINQLASSSLIVAASRNRRVVSDQDVHDAHIDRGRP